jgi:hypothetical protein
MIKSITNFQNVYKAMALNNNTCERYIWEKISNFLQIREKTFKFLESIDYFLRVLYFKQRNSSTLNQFEAENKNLFQLFRSFLHILHFKLDFFFI